MYLSEVCGAPKSLLQHTDKYQLRFGITFQPVQDWFVTKISPVQTMMEENF